MAAEKWESDINEVLLKYGVIRQPFQENAAKVLETALMDYNNLAQQYSNMLVKYGQTEKPIRQNNVWVCPDCGKKVPYNHSYCHWCGKKIGWDR